MLAGQTASFSLSACVTPRSATISSMFAPSQRRTFAPCTQLDLAQGRPSISSCIRREDHVAVSAPVPVRNARRCVCMRFSVMLPARMRTPTPHRDREEASGLLTRRRARLIGWDVVLDTASANSRTVQRLMRKWRHSPRRTHLTAATSGVPRRTHLGRSHRRQHLSER